MPAGKGLHLRAEQHPTRRAHRGLQQQHATVALVDGLEDPPEPGGVTDGEQGSARRRPDPAPSTDEPVEEAPEDERRGIDVPPSPEPP